MFLRRDRVNQNGRTNLEYRSGSIDRPEHLPRIEFLSTARSTKFDQIVKAKLSKTQINPVSTQKDFYATQGRPLHEEANLSRPRFAHLEEKERRKPVWVGDSQVMLNDRIDLNAERKHAEGSHRQSVNGRETLAQQKHDTHGRATQETQLIGMEEYSRETLKGVDLDKVREIRRAIRRRYANRKNFQKIFSLWDEEGKGAISVKNVFAMIKRFGLNLNVDEAKVLVASADRDQSGDLALDEFMDLIFNDNDAMNVNLKSLRVLSQQGNVPEDSQDVLDYLQEDAKKARSQRHHNQVNLVLKNKFQTLANACQDSDHLGSGSMNYEKLESIVRKLNISEKIISDEDIKNLFNEYKLDEHNFDYKQFLTNLKSFHLNSQDLYGGAAESVKPAQHNRLNLLANTQEDEKLHVFDCTRVNFHHLERIRTRATQLFRTIQRYCPTRDEFDKLLLDSKAESVTSEGLHKALVSFLTTVGEKPEQKDLEAALSVMQFNQDRIPTKEIGRMVYEEDDVQFFERCSQRLKGPAPMAQPDHKRSAPDAMELKDTFYDRKLGLQSSAPILHPKMVDILQKLEDRTFLASTRQYDVFKGFDLDKDGYVSASDFIKHVEKMSILNASEMGYLLNHIDPEGKGSLNFSEFSAKIYPGMTRCAHTGEQLVVNAQMPAKERYVNMKQHMADLKRIRSEELFIRPERATRFGATPVHKNTFYNIQQPPTNSAMFMPEEERFTKNPHSRIQFQKDEQSRYTQTYSNKLAQIRSHQELLFKRIEENFQASIVKDQNKCKTKGLAQFNYEQRAHMKNDWQ